MRFFRRAIKPRDVVTFIASDSRMIVRDVRGEMCEVAPIDDQNTEVIAWVNRICLVRK